MLQALLADRFQLTVRRETRELGVYNLVPDKKGPRLEEVSAAGRGVGLQKGTLNAFGADMATLANVLSRYVDRVVIDRTGIKGFYNFALKWTADDADPAGAALFAALQDQLGLKLEAAKAPVEVLAIDRAERPSQNFASHSQDAASRGPAVVVVGFITVPQRYREGLEQRPARQTLQLPLVACLPGIGLGTRIAACHLYAPPSGIQIVGGLLLSRIADLDVVVDRNRATRLRQASGRPFVLDNVGLAFDGGDTALDVHGKLLDVDLRA